MAINRDIGICWTMEDIRDSEGNLIYQKCEFYINGVKHLIMRINKHESGHYSATGTSVKFNKGFHISQADSLHIIKEMTILELMKQLEDEINKLNHDIISLKAIIWAKQMASEHNNKNEVR